VKFKLKVDAPQGVHQRVRVFAGPEEGQLASVGSLTMRCEEVQEFCAGVETIGDGTFRSEDAEFEVEWYRPKIATVTLPEPEWEDD
jgi:hypothetical protein